MHSGRGRGFWFALGSVLLLLGCSAAGSETTFQRVALPPFGDSMAVSGSWYTYIYMDTVAGEPAGYVVARGGEVGVWLGEGFLGISTPLSPLVVGSSSDGYAPGWYLLRCQPTDRRQPVRSFLVTRMSLSGGASGPNPRSREAGAPALVASLNRTARVVLLLFPFLLLVLWRASESASFDALVYARGAYRKRYEASEQGNLLRGISLVWVLLLRVVLVAGVLAALESALIDLPVKFQVLDFPLWRTLHEASNWASPATLPLFGFPAAALLVLLYRYGLLAVVGTGYGWRVFVRWIVGLDTLATLPFLLVPYVLFWAGMLTPSHDLQRALSVSGILALAVYLVVHMQVLGRGILRRQLFSWVGLALYICVVEILPWLLYFLPTEFL